MNYRKKANLILMLVLICFGIAMLFKHLYPLRFSSNLAYYVTEAALVGGIADWFAITALFKKPLGWPFHTALIPRNRAKLIEAVANMVEQDLLGLDLIRTRIAGIDFAAGGLKWIEQNKIIPQVAIAMNNYFRDKINRSGSLCADLTRLIRNWLSQVPYLNLLPRITGYLENKGPGMKKLESLLFDILLQVASRPTTRQAIYVFLLDQKNLKRDANRVNKFTVSLMEKTNLLDLEEAATILHRQLILALEQMRDSANPARQFLERELAGTLQTLAGTPAFTELVHQLPSIIENLPWQSCVEVTLSKLTENRDNSRPKLEYLSGQVLMELQSTIRSSTALREQINQTVLALISRISASHHGLIGDTVRRTLNSLSNEELNRFIEDKAGEDLQWIRINGSLIGGLAGLTIYLVFNFLVIPYFHIK